jgi:hypothetical protein
MTENTSHTFSSRCEILGELWLDYREDEQFKDFIDYNDLGLPLAYAIDSEIVQATEIATQYVDETFDLFTQALGVESDYEWTSLNQMLEYARDTGTFPE